MKNKLLTVVVTLSMVFTSLFSGTTILATTNAEADYEIYPTPQQVAYKQGSYIIRPNVNAIVEEKIDSATTNRLDEILRSKNKQVTKEPSKQAGKTNIYLGIYGSNKSVDQYVKSKYKFNKDIFDKEGAYFLASNNDEIVVLGKNSDAVFYGLTTLKHIFNQMDGSTIRNFEIEDYANTKIRGFIEGYYGIPWSNEDRMSLMKFGGDFKMTSYIFAPKDDPYHKEKWRELYPDEALNEIKKMAAVGNASKCRFVWTAHPFMGGFNQAKKDEEIQSLLKKFDQLYDAGIRQFGVLGDDVGNLPRSIVIEMMTAVSDWAKEKGDVYDTVFCPGGYNHAWQKDYSELNEYDKGFPKDIQIFWTGEAVCKPIEQVTLDHFRRANSTNGERRAPLFWLNWPVNDINHSRMLMGKGVQLHKDINVNDLYGAVTNPMQEAEASKVAIFAVADYTWNVKKFNVDKSWEDSFEYIEPNASEELHTLAKHMSNPEPNGHGLVLPESEELQPLLNAFKQALKENKSVVDNGTKLINELNKIIDACDGFHAKSQNKALKEELLPFTNSLKDLCISIRSFIHSKISLENGDKYDAFNYYTEGSSYLNQSKTYTKSMIGGGKENVDPASTHLIPLANMLEKHLSEPMNDYISGQGKEKLKITASSSFNTWHSGDASKIIDGDDRTHAWHDNYEAKGQYYQVEYNIPQTIYGVHILNGANQDGKHTDTFGTGKVMYKVANSDNWVQLGDKIYNNYPERVDISSIEIKDVVAVRYECEKVGSQNKWPSMREFRVSLQPENGTQFTKEVIHTPTHWTISDEQKAKMVDGNLQSAAHFAVRNNNNYGQDKDTTLIDDYVGLKLSTPITLGKIDILQGRNDGDGDYMKKAKLQYHDGTQWVDIPEAIFDNQRHIKIDLSNKEIKTDKIRLVSLQKQATWIAIREFDVKEKQFFNAKAYTNVSSLIGHNANIFDDNATLAPKNDVELNKGEYIGLKLNRIHEITEIKNDLENANNIELQVSKNGIEWKKYTSGTVNARYVRLINTKDGKQTFNIKELSMKSREIYPKEYLQDLSSFGLYEPDRNPASNLFDGDWTNQVVFQGSQHKGNKFVYDLGQEIDLNKLEVVCRDSEHDFPRHAVISVSTNKETWEPVMELGRQDSDYDGEATDQDNIMNVLPDHKTSYNTKTADKIGKKARYIKFEITRNKAGNDKWVRFQEFVINDGAYMPSVNNPTFESSCQDTQNGKFENMVDGDLSTAYIPSNKTGHLTYTVSDNNEVNVIKFVQSSDAISNAVVKARTFDNPEQWIELGTLSQTVNEFILPNDTLLLDVKVEWANKSIRISELVLSKTEFKEANKTELNNLLAENINTTTWTKNSVNAYRVAIEAGRLVSSSKNISQSSVDSAISSITKAKENAEIKGDMALLEKALQDAIKDKENYTAKSWRLYENVLNAIKAAKENAENTSTKDVEKLLTTLENAKTKLVYNPSNMEESVLAVQAENDFIATVEKSELIYTENSWKAYKESKKAIDTLIEKNRGTAVHPTEFKKALDSMKASKDALVNISELKTLIKEFEETDKSMYSKETFSKYEKAVNDSKSLLVDGTKEAVVNAISKINNAKKGLQLNTSLETLNKLIKECEGIDGSNYTKASFDALNSVLAEVKGKDLTNLSDQELKAEINKLNNAKNGLISVEALKESLKVAKDLDKNLYTSSSYNNLNKVIKDSEKLLNNGTKEEISKQISNIDQAIKGLVLRANEKDVKEYMESIQLVDGSLYTKESYNAYMSAYNVLNKLVSNLDDLSVETYLKAKDNFEAAKANLVKLTDKKPTDSSNGSNKKPSTGSTTNTALLWSVLLGAGAVLLLTLKRRNVETK